MRLDVSQRPPPMACDLGVELVDQGGDRKPRAVAAGFVEDDREVLAHPVDREPEIETALEHRPMAVLHLP